MFFKIREFLTFKYSFVTYRYFKINNVIFAKIIEVKKDPTGKKKQKPKNNFKKVDKKEHLSRFTDIDELDRKINSMIEENRNKSSLIEQVY